MRALVLAGGGNKGAYQAGVIRYLLRERGVRYDLYCGVSAGALNAAYLAQFASGTEHIAADTLSNIWAELDQSKIYQKWWPWGEFAALWKTSLYDASPLRRLVSRLIVPERAQISGKMLRIGAVSLNTGAYKVFGEAYSDLVSAVMASSAFPGVFPPVQLGDDLFTDGGVREQTPLNAATSVGATEVDVILCSPESGSVPLVNPTAIQVALRSLEILTDEILSNDLRLSSQKGAPKSAIRTRVIRPRFPLSANPLDFSNETLRHLVKLGSEDARLTVLREGLRW